jgi:hypothetical protein
MSSCPTIALFDSRDFVSTAKAVVTGGFVFAVWAVSEAAKMSVTIGNVKIDLFTVYSFATDPSTL